MQVGDKIALFDGQSDLEFVCEIRDVEKKQVVVSVLSAVSGNAERKIKVHLYQAVPNKMAKFEEVLKKGTELGVASFHPVKFSRSETKFKELPKQDRLQNIMIEACEQCGGTVIPELGNIVSFEEAVATAPGLKIMAYEGECELTLSDIQFGDEISLFIGPEGGITEEEAAQFDGDLFNLGKRILRTETAPIAVLGRIML